MTVVSSQQPAPVRTNDIWLRILGPLEVTGSEHQFQPRSNRQRIVLARVLLDVNQVVSAQRPVEAVWAGRPPATAREQIQICVSGLRRSLTEVGLPDVIATKSPGYLILATEGQLDLTVRSCHISCPPMSRSSAVETRGSRTCGTSSTSRSRTTRCGSSPSLASAASANRRSPCVWATDS